MRSAVIAIVVSALMGAGAAEAVHVIRGPRGPAGPRGARGPGGALSVFEDVGPRGLQGPTGPAGQQGYLQGATGAQGPRGEVGERGPQGNEGHEGPRGSFQAPKCATVGKQVLCPQDEWHSEFNYEAGSIVKWHGALWVARIDNRAGKGPNINHEPPQPDKHIPGEEPELSEWWEEL